MTAPNPVSSHAEDLLLPNLWCRVFQYLTVVQLRRVRLTCAHWKRLVDGDPALMDRVVIRIEARNRPKNLPPARTAEFKRCRITTVDPWWPEIGRNLTGLRLENCYVSIATLLSMFRLAPNLKRLEVKYINHSKISPGTVIGFQLEHLEELTLVDVKDPELMNLLYMLRPPLKKLVFNNSALKPGAAIMDEAVVIRFVRHNEATLEELRVPFNAALMESLPSMGRLRLKRASYSWAKGVAPILGFCKLQPALQELDISELSTTDLTFNEIATLLPNLRHLSVRFEWESTDLVASFLSAMPQLESLTIVGPVPFNGSQRITKFGTICCPALKQFKLSSFTIPSNDLYQFFKNSAQIRSVTLEHCKLGKRSDLLGALKQLPNLQRLKLTNVRTPNWNDSVEFGAENLNHLELSYLNIPEAALIRLLSDLPKLEELKLYGLKFLNDRVVHKFSQRLPKLTKLSISVCPISDVSMHHLNLHCKFLEHLELGLISGLSQQAVNRLKTRLEIVRFATGPSKLKEILLLLMFLALLYFMFQWYGYVGIVIALSVLFMIPMGHDVK